MKYHMENSSLKSIFHSTYESMKVLVQQKWLDFIIKIPENDVIIYVDKNKLKQVLINLISNAIKFTPKGSITLSGEIIWENIKISVTDTWIGIPQDKQKSIFDKFYQVDSYIQRKTDGVWLWLSISQNIIKDFWSIIEICSEIDQWTQFHFTLPIQKE
jgi:signal transduction histidine kinase